MEKDDIKNIVKVLPEDYEDGKLMETAARPLMSQNNYTLIEIKLITKKTHQIKAHLAKAGYPIIGDAKYGDSNVNKKVERQFNLTTQFLHACRLEFTDAEEPLKYLKGKKITGELPPNLEKIKISIFG